MCSSHLESHGCLILTAQVKLFSTFPGAIPIVHICLENKFSFGPTESGKNSIFYALHFTGKPRNSERRTCTTVVTKQWKDWVKSCNSDHQQQTRVIVDRINDENFLNEVENIFAITRPIYSVLRFINEEGPC
jgi:hypothetical protein